MSTVILCGMPEEKEVLQEALPGLLVLSGTDKLNLPLLVPSDCKLIVSMGLCGGLMPRLPVNAVVIAKSVKDKSGEIATPFDCFHNDYRWFPVYAAPYYSSGLLDESDTVTQRAALYAKYGAWAMDDETRYAVALAQQRKIGFGVLRAVSDDWTETLPLAATGAILNKDGTANISYLIASLAKQPEQIPQLFKIARDFVTSLQALKAAATACRGFL